MLESVLSFFFQAEDGIRDYKVTGVQTCALPIYAASIERDVSEGSSRCAQGAVQLRERDADPPHHEDQREHRPRRSPHRSEERRVGKEWRSRRTQGHEKKEKERERECSRRQQERR